MSDAEAKEAEEKVIYSLTEKKVSILGKPVSLKPLPSKPAKQLSSILNVIVKEFNRIGSLKAEEREATPLGGLDAQLADVITEAVLTLSNFYGWGFNLSDIEGGMTVSEQKKLIEAQAEVNGEDDFLLHPLRLISQALSQTAKVIKDLGKAPSTPPSPSSGESLH